MKRLYSLFQIGLLLFILSSCNTEDIHLDTESILTTLTSRNTSHELSLPEGSKALFNATGGLNLDQQVLTFQNGYWEENGFPWKDTQETTFLTALYPVFANNDYSTANLYQTGELTDILISKVELHQKENIHLTFQHLFSQLIIQASQEVQQDLQQIKITTPHQIMSIDPKSGSFSIANSSHTTTLSKNEDGNYSILIPPATNAVIHLDITSKEGDFSCNLKTFTFESNHTYTCNLVKKSNKPGIYSAEDLILFSKLINGEKIEGKSLKDFGYTIDGQTIYPLQNDLILTSEDNKRLLPICFNQDYPFNDIFEGNNHTICHYSIPDEHPQTKLAYDYGAFISCMGSKGVVRNLHFSQVKSTSEICPHYQGVITGYSEGLIDHCSVTDSNIDYNRNNSVGMIACTSHGTILNCWINQCTVRLLNKRKSNEKGSGIAGGITATLFGNLINSYAKDFAVTFDKGHKGIGGSFAAKVYGENPQNLPAIFNCYSYTSYSLPSRFGSLVGYAMVGKIKYAYCNNRQVCYSYDQNNFSFGYSLIDNNYNKQNGQPLQPILNQWIDNNENQYRHLTFHRWKKLNDGMPVLE